LTIDGVESNPGPGWKEFEEEVLAKFGTEAPVGAIKKAINKPFINTVHIREFLHAPLRAVERKDLGIDETILSDLLKILDSLERMF
jgi:hypothetical protein